MLLRPPLLRDVAAFSVSRPAPRLRGGRVSTGDVAPVEWLIDASLVQVAADGERWSAARLRAMQRLADGVHAIALTPRHGINAYVVGDVLVDAGIPLHGRKLVKALAGHTITAHALTHVHPDHAGGSAHVAEALGVPVWVGTRDAPALRAGQAESENGFVRRTGAFPAVEPAQELVEGDKLGDTGFVVLDTPGHSVGHVSFWRESDRVLVCGDAVFNMHPLTTVPGVRLPPKLLTVDPAQNARSVQRIAELEPALLLAGHGPPLRDPAALRVLAGL